jgi:GNAT superfamily N-acetyltransferase
MATAVVARPVARPQARARDEEVLVWPDLVFVEFTVVGPHPEGAEVTIGGHGHVLTADGVRDPLRARNLARIARDPGAVLRAMARPVLERPGRLVFRPEPDDEVILDVVRRVHSQTLDAHALLAIEKGGLQQAAEEELEFFTWCPSPRDWWRLAYTPEGELVGIEVPVHNPSGPAVGFIGVVPEQRGHGYGHDLLVECTRHLVDQGAQFIAAATDVANAGMAKNFARAGYPVVRHRYVMAHRG